MDLNKPAAGSTARTRTVGSTETTTITFATSLEDYILGTEGADIISGGASTLAYSTDGADTMEGGLDDDWYIVNDTTDVIIEYAGEGNDTVFTTVNYTLLTELENIVAAGAAAVTLTGSARDNILDGSQQTTGVDTLIGGAGNDTYILSASDKVNADTSGIDTVMASFAIDISSASATTNFAANSATVIENVTLTGSTAVNITGNALNNRLTGNSGTNTIIGGAGNDTLDSGTGGTDVFDGGAGNDIYIIRSGATASITDASGTDTVRVFASAGTTLADSGIENVTLLGSTNSTNITGNELNNVLIGNSGTNSITGGAGNDTLKGGGGADTLQGGAGNDVYMVDATDTVTESASEGTDSVQLGGTTLTAFLLQNNVENLTMTGTLALKASAAGSSTNHSLTGNSGANTLTGGLGNDTLNGGTGADTFAGGAGNDIYYFDNTGDTITSDTSGTDSVQITAASGTFTVASGVETITLNGSTALSVTAGGSTNNLINGNSGINTLNAGSGNDSVLGNAGNDILNGGAGNDTLNGGTGNDALTGGTGDDKYLVDSSTDTVVELTGEGTDTVESTASFTLTSATPANDFVENLTLAGTAVSGTGNLSNNTITGNTSNNSLDGLAGADTINGGAGNDTITGGTGRDVVVTGAGDDQLVFAALVTDTVATATSVAGVDLYSDLLLNGGGDDLINLIETVVNVGTTVTGSLDEATFVDNMNTLLNVGSGAGFNTSVANTITAAIVTANDGDLAGRTFLAVDVVASDTFTAADFVIEITGSTVTSLTAATFV